jgi:hypothetical protein
MIKKNQLLFDLNELDKVAEDLFLTVKEKAQKETIVLELERTSLLKEIS